MLKAVRFDENYHKNLLEFIHNFYDNRGKLNESEGMRYLMQLGLDSLSEAQPSNDFNSMKEELLKEILQTMNSQNGDLLNKLDKIQPIYIPVNKELAEKPIEKPVYKNPKKVITPGNSNTLLNNLLNNSNK